MPITWDGSLAMGLPEIDVEHRHFVELLAALERAVGQRNEAKHLADVFDEVRNYIRFHFAHEERCFDEFGCYPEADTHKKAHAAFADHVSELRYRFLNDAPAGAVALTRTMYDWLDKHIAHMDRGYEECFRAHGMGEKKPHGDQTRQSA